MLALFGHLALGQACALLDTAVSELCLLSSYSGALLLLITMSEFSLYRGGHLVLVLLRKNLTVCHGLDGGVVVVLVDLSVNSGGLLLMAGWLGLSAETTQFGCRAHLDNLLSDGWSDPFQRVNYTSRRLIDQTYCSSTV